MTTATARKYHPILFSPPMVEAILDGRKTQTRRIVMSGAKNMQESGQVCVKRNPDNDPWYKEYIWSVRGRGGIWGDYTNAQMLARCPYGAVGDLLWVRERWRSEQGSPCYYTRCHCGLSGHHGEKGWKPSIFMPHEACRIELRIESIRVQPLQSLTEDDASAEGIWENAGIGDTHGIRVTAQNYRRACFAVLWDSINKERGYGWDTNPYVWAVTFKKVKDTSADL